MASILSVMFRMSARSFQWGASPATGIDRSAAVVRELSACDRLLVSAVERPASGENRPLSQ
ncbi:hypothetical protein ACH474_08045 [Nocardia rhamnosiphila]|uniref:hypothetical protein n=1 Tax=Nocardia rhamnosiphila TaxID=426716 RepID=UPI000A656565